MEMNAQTFPRAVIWDMDGTLVDTAELHFQAWAALAGELNKPFTRADFAATFGWRNPEIIPKVFGSQYASREVQELGDRKEVLYRAQARKGVELLPGVRSLLEALQTAGFKQAIGSSAPRANLDLIVQLTGTTAFFQAVVSMEDTTRGKPDPEVFLKAADKLAVPPKQCLVIEDAPAGIQAARAGSMRAIAVTFIGHHEPQILQQAGADLIVPSLEQVSAQTISTLLQGE
jgi:beta-phosphoglucomutase